MSDFATESGHWYLPNGEPCYTTTGKNGKERPVTLRDARKLGLVPSVTGIIKMAAAPALERWKRNQLLLAALTLPRKPDEPEADWLARIEQDWQEQGRVAADRGTAIHGAIEQFYRGEGIFGEYEDHVFAVVAEIEQFAINQIWSAERSFAHALGYGGKTDLHSDEWVIDIKTKDSLDNVEIYDEHVMQLAAYRRGLGVYEARCGILFVNREAPQAMFIEAEQEYLARGLVMFDHLLGFWQAKHNYRPAAVSSKSAEPNQSTTQDIYDGLLF